MSIPNPNPNIEDSKTCDNKTWSSSKINSVIYSAAELPEVTQSDEGKALMVNSSGEWDAEDIPSDLPSVTTSDEGKALMVNSSGEWNTENIPKELPNINPTLDPGKVLCIDPDTGNLTWTSFSELIQRYLQSYPYIDEFDPIASDGYSIARSTLNDILKYEFDSASQGDVLYFDGNDWTVGSP